MMTNTEIANKLVHEIVKNVGFAEVVAALESEADNKGNEGAAVLFGMLRRDLEALEANQPRR